ncbi:MAG: helix-turn-helix domain-containing protein [Selenomonadaceae bacterium]|nr:helix-turn-helix domain-containing protein [Selenomonadaceae bacterium]
MNNSNSTLITVEELCDELLIGKNLAYRLLIEGKIKAFRIGRTWKIPRQSINEFITQQSSLVTKK